MRVKNPLTQKHCCPQCLQQNLNRPRGRFRFVNSASVGGKKKCATSLFPSKPFLLSPHRLSPLESPLTSRFVAAITGEKLSGDPKSVVKIGGGEGDGGREGHFGGVKGDNNSGGGEEESGEGKEKKISGMSMSQKLTLGYTALVGDEHLGKYIPGHNSLRLSDLHCVVTSATWKLAVEAFSMIQSLFIQGMFLLSNITAGNESHKEAVIRYLAPLQAYGYIAPFIIKFIQILSQDGSWIMYIFREQLHLRERKRGL